MGQGARTVFAQIAAEELGVPVDKVATVMSDTGTVPFDQQTSASRSTVIMGTAVLNACRDIQAQVRAAASRRSSDSSSSRCSSRTTPPGLASSAANGPPYGPCPLAESPRSSSRSSRCRTCGLPQSRLPSLSGGK